ncbi:hypothetical protein AB0L74_30835 [Streptomyces sp. NPDC052020]|uniref:GP88 family protein n=1 Tax=Streptomyces sp. NPDC052020 TaxID=3155677 RepID=UPI0034174A77
MDRHTTPARRPRACAKLCYARVGTYRWPVVLAAHGRNMWVTMHALDEWEAQMVEELRHRRYRGCWARSRRWVRGSSCGSPPSSRPVR